MTIQRWAPFSFVKDCRRPLQHVLQLVQHKNTCLCSKISMPTSKPRQHSQYLYLWSPLRWQTWLTTVWGSKKPSLRK